MPKPRPEPVETSPPPGPEVVVHHPGHVTIDGVPAGSVVDVLANYAGRQRGQPDLRAPLQRAIEACHAGLCEDRERARGAAEEMRAAVRQEANGEHRKVLDEALAEAAAGRERLEAAHRARLEELQAAAAEQKRQLMDEQRSALDRLAATLRAEFVKVLSQRDSVIAEQAAKILDLRAQVEALGGTELGQRLAREKRCRELREQRAEIEAKLAEAEGREP